MSIVTQYKQGTPCWVDLSTTNGPSAKSFYTDLFGWEWTDMPIGNGAIYSMAKYKDQWVAGLFDQTQDPSFAGMPSFWGVAIAVDDVDVAAAKVVTAGGQIMMPVDDVPNDSGRMCIAVDPQGAAFTLWQAKNHIGTGVVNESNTVVWHELTVPDISKVLPFYKEVAGMDAITEPMGDQDYTQFQVDGNTVAGGMNAQEGMPAAWTVYFATPDLDAALEKVRNLGGQIVAPAFEIPYGRMAVVSDPNGAVFAVMKLNEEEV